MIKFTKEDFATCPAYEPAAQDSADRANAKLPEILAALIQSKDLTILGLTIPQISKIKDFYIMNTGNDPKDL